jgi:hypothetical protein
MISGYQLSAAVSVAAELGIADLLAQGPKTSAELAASTKTHPHTLYRLLRALAAAGVFHEGEAKSFSLTPISEGLRSDAKPSMRPQAILVGRSYYPKTWNTLGHSIRTGENAFEHAYGKGLWEWRAEHPEESKIFDASMTGGSEVMLQAMLDGYDFSGFSTVMDVGGGQGALISAILSKNHGPKGILFDQPHVVTGELLPPDVAARCQVVGGDFFKELPAGADAITMKWILHDWPDKECIDILKVTRKAIAPGGKLLVLERVVAGPNEGRGIKFADLTMMVLPGGMERTPEEFSTLLAAGGFRLDRIVYTHTGMNVIEASPI